MGANRPKNLPLARGAALLRDDRRRNTAGPAGNRLVAAISLVATLLLGLNALVQAISVILKWR